MGMGIQESQCNGFVCTTPFMLLVKSAYKMPWEYNNNNNNNNNLFIKARNNSSAITLTKTI